MNVGFGKYKDVDIRRLVIHHPDYAKWVLNQKSASGQLGALAASLRRYVEILDAKPFVKECRGNTPTGPCHRPVALGTAYSSHSGFNTDLCWWCDTCDPYQLGAVARLIPVRSYADALMVVEHHDGRKSDYVDIVTELLRAKGMPKRVTMPALEVFFGR